MLNLDNQFKQWLVGLIEAEGQLSVNKRGDLSIIITQGYKNIYILYYIKRMLGFGSVLMQAPTIFRYVIYSKKDIYVIITMLNGNLVLNKRLEEYKNFVDCYNKKYNENIEVITDRYKPTLKDAWLSGFTEGGGCFDISYIESKDRFDIRYILTQKEDLTFMREIYGCGSIEYNKTRQCYKFVIKDQCTAKDPNMGKVIKYFEEFKLRTTKLNSYSLWGYVANQIYNTEMTEEKKAGLKTLIKLINGE